jgi:hypothetical protein
MGYFVKNVTKFAGVRKSFAERLGGVFANR